MEQGEYRETNNSRESSLTVLFRSDGIVAVCKPAGSSTEEVLGLLSAQLQHPITQVSRLDLPTSGVLVAAVGSASSQQAWWLLAQFAGRLLSKSYLCLCFGAAPAGAEREVCSPLQTTHSPDGYSRTEARNMYDKKSRWALFFAASSQSCTSGIILWSPRTNSVQGPSYLRQATSTDTRRTLVRLSAV